MVDEGAFKSSITHGPKHGFRTWLVADGKPDALRTHRFEAAIEQARQALEEHGVRLKGFPHDWSAARSQER